MSYYEYYRNLILSLACISLGIALGWTHLTQENGGFPYPHELVEISGQVEWVQSYDYGIRFGFIQTDRNFNYMSKMDGQGLVFDSLINANAKTVRVLFQDSDPNSPIYSDDEYFSVFEIEIDNQMVRSLSESEEAWRSDNFLAPFLITMFLVGGVYLGNKTLKARKNA